MHCRSNRRGGARVIPRLEFLRRKKKSQALSRIVAALRFRIASLVREPRLHERDFMNLTSNHGQFSDKLRRLGQNAAAIEIQKNAFYIGLRWLELGQEHLDDAAASLAANRKRSTFSRAYYAAYNASKGVRYIVSGSVGLTGDDHNKASDLPNDFPSGDRWAAMIPRLYEHRLFSDYDNWRSTGSEHSLTPQEAYDLAQQFVATARSYLQRKFGI